MINPAEFQLKKDILESFLNAILDSWDHKKKEMSTNNDALKLKAQIWEQLDELVKAQIKKQQMGVECHSQVIMLKLQYLYKWFKASNENCKDEDMYNRLKVELHE